MVTYIPAPATVAIYRDFLARNPGWYDGVGAGGVSGGPLAATACDVAGAIPRRWWALEGGNEAISDANPSTYGEMVMPAAGTLRRLTVYVSANTLNGNGAYVAVAVNGVDSTLKATVNQLTGSITVTGAVAFNAGDTITLHLVTAAPATAGVMSITGCQTRVEWAV